MARANVMLDGVPHAFDGDAGLAILELQAKIKLMTHVGQFAQTLDAHLATQTEQLNRIEAAVTKLLATKEDS